MPAENVHHRKGTKKYSIVLIPGDEAEKTRSFSFDKFGAAALILGLFFVIIIVGAVAIVYTPVGNLVPIPGPKLEQTYGKQITQIQEQMNVLVKEITVLRNYNVRLRKALGERITSIDSTFAMSNAPASPSDTQSREPQANDVDRFAVTESTAGHEAITGLVEEKKLLPKHVAKAKEEFTNDVFPLTMPADGYMTRDFDAEHDHFGIDIAGKRGSAVLAAADGSVVFAGWTYDDGFMMMIGHSKGYMTVYKHNETLLKSTGAIVRRGDIIALLGNTGRTSSGPHLHFEVWKDGVVYNPDNYLLTTQ